MSWFHSNKLVSGMKVGMVTQCCAQFLGRGSGASVTLTNGLVPFTQAGFRKQKLKQVTHFIVLTQVLGERGSTHNTFQDLVVGLRYGRILQTRKLPEDCLLNNRSRRRRAGSLSTPFSRASFMAATVLALCRTAVATASRIPKPNQSRKTVPEPFQACLPKSTVRACESDPTGALHVQYETCCLEFDANLDKPNSHNEVVV